MGGSKNISPAKAQKRQKDDASKKDGAKSKKGKKDDKGEQKSSKAVITVVMAEEQANKIINGSKVITVQELARQTGVKISTANAFLIRSLEKGTVKRVAGYSGHHIYQPVSA